MNEEIVINTPLIDDEMVDIISKHENNISHLYLDTKGKPTVGIGILIPSEKEMLKYPFFLKKGNGEDFIKATPELAIDAYRRILKKPYGQQYTHTTYDPSQEENGLIPLHLDPDFSRAKVKEILAREEEFVRSKIPRFDQMPRPARQVLLDMQYNLGDRKFRPDYIDEKTGRNRGWPKLFDALMREDYEAASQELHSNDVGPERNEWRRTRMLEALRERQDSVR